MRSFRSLSAYFMLLVAVVMLVWFTFAIGRTYIDLVAGSKHFSGNKKMQDEEIVFKLPGLDFWTCQVGLFQSEENANKEKARLKELGWEAEILTEKPWTVAIGLGYSGEDLKVLIDNLKQNGINVVQKHFKLQEQSYKIAGNGSRVTASFLQSTNKYLSTTGVLEKQKELDVLAKYFSSSYPQELHNFKQIVELMKDLPSQTIQLKMMDFFLYKEYNNTLIRLSQKAKNL
ncbi:MAG: SPOR domain-containing protein [Desulfitobacterium hafniense]|nr:SPOR domain-containing protein [Desulfitobacterium hafniense]